MHLLSGCVVATAVVLVLISLGAAPPAAVDAATGTFIYAGCSPSKYEPNTAFQSNLNSLLSSIASTASSTSRDGAFLSSRDGVLGELQAAAGYKLSTSGTVQGVAQCLGDVPANDCTACLAEAVGQLKGACGTALAADVYLAQCYVRYWANGYYFRSNSDNSGDDVGRTVAIIIGILAGLALLVVFISFLRKAYDKT
uniref:Gnk2-homologous domain-containing protein n=1 Tax=Oryza barthii TaxID=65489 RepID=A0A0D3F856_9ORYZ